MCARLRRSVGRSAAASLARSWPFSGLRAAPKQKHAAYGIGLRVTRHPRMGAAEELKVTLRELAENRRLIEKLQQKRYSGGERRLLTGNHMSFNPLARFRPRCPNLSNARRACGLSPKILPGGAL